jgi:ABC-type iron transport system FetAB ATPase subunit
MTMILTIGRKSYVLGEDADTSTILHEIELAVRAGGAFVELPVGDQKPVSVLIAPATSVSVHENETATAASVEDPRHRLSYLDEFDGISGL